MRDGNNLVKNILYSEYAVKYAYCNIWRQGWEEAEVENCGFG